MYMYVCMHIYVYLFIIFIYLLYIYLYIMYVSRLSLLNAVFQRLKHPGLICGLLRTIKSFIP